MLGKSRLRLESRFTIWHWNVSALPGPSFPQGPLGSDLVHIFMCSWSSVEKSQHLWPGLRSLESNRKPMVGHLTCGSSIEWMGSNPSFAAYQLCVFRQVT